MIRVLIVEDGAGTGDDLTAELTREPDMEVTGQAASFFDAVELAARAVPDVVVLELEAGNDGVDTARALSRAPASPPVLAVTSDGENELALEAIRAGAAGLCDRTEQRGGLAEAVRGVAAGHAVVAPALLREVVDCLPVAGAALDLCTLREREVLSLVALGATNHEICEQLVVSDATVRTHIRNLRRKLGARSRAELVSRAFRLGLVSAGLAPAPAPAPAG